MALNLQSVIELAITQVDHLLLVIKEPAGDHVLEALVQYAISQHPRNTSKAAIMVLSDLMQTLRKLESGLNVDQSGVIPKPIDKKTILETLKSQLEVITEVMDRGRPSACRVNVHAEMYAQLAVSQPTDAAFNAIGCAVHMLRINQQAHAHQHA
ncbi:MAG: hypothetical protein A2898_00710 [Candidatus Kerfeldbacteria bacterium RIFCSPLOWO2_01_FULL_48_11]|uniref:Uncharacterized protein n=1 Tax=Candidatus Kerfeldbacteria bacterium RIFCSPLOWO2_01_FULL_48_11 TaxID=1798543 RepID=A0A1G2B1K0_9BACT|nr:MAG: hypothetical protein UY34_C0024G0006 [Parcubacteria group bacterium GW2011_GWA2_48_9]KKW16017.1 MAG: hypothetical protein UY52_C0011G0005 [Parcubacteria group bacterium GW2011_GWC2_49_9]OGY83028.1 MAG: hypothetical protein A2898_00710 [Candidatus Kerfeldbacteria bacterium RIFCSPLOWO2_01_FULL_48_11]